MSDFLVTGTKAITRKVELVNMDYLGSRVAAMIFGLKSYSRRGRLLM